MNNDWLYASNNQHLRDLRHEAAQERLVHEVPHKAGLLETALALLNGKRAS